METARSFDDVAGHPEPRARLAYAHFGTAQRLLRSTVDWGGLRAGRLAALGGLTVEVAGEAEPRFLPLSFELFDPKAGALDDLLEDLGVYGAPATRRGRRARNKDTRPPRLYSDFLFPWTRPTRTAVP